MDPTVQIHVTQIALLGQVGVVVLSHAAAVTKLKLEIVQLQHFLDRLIVNFPILLR